MITPSLSLKRVRIEFAQHLGHDATFLPESDLEDRMQAFYFSCYRTMRTARVRRRRLTVRVRRERLEVTSHFPTWKNVDCVELENELSAANLDSSVSVRVYRVL